MFSSPILSRSNKQQSTIDMMTTKRIIDEKSKTIEQLKTIIDELQIRHERKERELLKRVGLLYNDLQQNKKKMAHLIYKHQQQQQKKVMCVLK
jgi:DNA-directed RNA polymerase delta subunit